MTSTDRKWWLVTIVAAAAAATWFAFRPVVMPLDQQTLEAFQEANSREMARLQDRNDGRSFYEVTADGFRKAVRDTGYNPDKTLLYWMSDEFKAEVAADPKRSVDLTRLTDSLLRSALGEGAPDDERARVLALHSAEVQAAAHARRP